ELAGSVGVSVDGDRGGRRGGTRANQEREREDREERAFHARSLRRAARVNWSSKRRGKGRTTCFCAYASVSRMTLKPAAEMIFVAPSNSGYAGEASMRRK